ncbi:hypothetical protein M0805_007105 [Coniferiporia weirii]|nr:hypothetical protein M0805_007105 [Coniferiporia weirii]
MFISNLRCARSALRIRGLRICLKVQVSPGRRTLSSSASSTPFNVLFIGRDKFSVLVLEELYRTRDVWNAITVATYPDGKMGRRHSIPSISPLKLRSHDLGLETHLVPKEEFKEWQPPSPFLQPVPSSNNILITASFGQMIPNRLLHLFPVSKRLNVHPSLIPLYRGPAPIQHTIGDGQEHTGVCVLEMKERKFGADGGEVWASKSMPIPSRPHYTELRDTLGTEGGKLLVSVLRDMIVGTANASPQDDSKATHAPFITPEMAMIDFRSWNADKIDRMYRAIAHQRAIITTLPSSNTLQLHSPYAFVPTSEDLPKPLKALQEPGDATFDPTMGSLAIRCANDTYVYVPSLKQQGKKLLAAKDWWNGVRAEWIPDKVLKLGA